VHNIEYTEIEQQTWKAAIAGKGVCAAAAKAAKASAEASGAGESAVKAAASHAEKAAAKAACEKMLGFSFPINLFICGRWLKFRDDASDATAIGLWGVKQHSSLAFASSFRLSAPGLPKPRPGKAMSVAVPPADTSSASNIAADNDGAPSADPPFAVRMLRDPWICTLVDGCTLRTNHKGHCKIAEVMMPRSAGRERPDVCALLGRRPAKKPRVVISVESGD